jgi:eukaryotic-like serine/threonine-protein kinase
MYRPYDLANVTFQLRDEIGAEGKNSQVFVAHDPQLDAELVVKRIEKARMDADSYFAESACIYASAHPNVVPIHYACQDDDCIYVAMPFYQNGSLKRLMDSRFLTVREIVVLSTQFLSGLHHIHSKRLVHFDVKPDNILLSDRGEALIADFGLAKARGINGLAGQDVHYTKMAPPEAIRHADHFDNRYDIYQVGLTLFRMCVGDAVFYAQYDSYFDAGGQLDRGRFSHAVLNAQFPNTANDVFPEHVPDALVRVIRKCLQDLDQRYNSAIEVVNDLAPIEGELLDWQFSVDATGKHWRKQAEDMTIALDLAPDRSSVARKGRVGGAERRITEYCSAALNRQATKRFLREN